MAMMKSNLIKEKSNLEE